MVQADRRSFHKCVKSFVTDEKTKQWSPTQMYPTLSTELVAEKCAKFFNNISSEYQALDLSKLPTTFEGGRY